MNNLIRNLAILLALQIGILALVQFKRDRLTTFASSQNLLPFSEKEVTAVTITMEKDKKLTLTRNGEKWRVDDGLNFPASNSKVSESIGKLLKLPRPFPVATTEAAAKKLDLTEEGFDRKVEFALGEVKKIVYLGTVPSFKRVHVKLADEPESYVVEYGSYGLGVEPKDWYDRDFLVLGEDQVNSVEVNGLKLIRNDKTWSVEGTTDGEEGVEAELRGALNSLLRVTFAEMLGKEDKPEYNQKSPEATYKIIRSDGTERIMAFSKLKEGDDYILKASDQPYYFKVIAHNVKSIKEIAREKLVQKKEAKGEEAAEKNNGGTTTLAN